MDTKEAGEKGGLVRSEPKRLALKENLRKAREAKLRYRMDPTQRPQK
jgi:hypothetical protein